MCGVAIRMSLNNLIKMETRFQQGNKDSIDLLTSESYTSTSAPHNLSNSHQQELLLCSLMSSLTIGLTPLDSVTKSLPIFLIQWMKQDVWIISMPISSWQWRNSNGDRQWHGWNYQVSSWHRSNWSLPRQGTFNKTYTSSKLLTRTQLLPSPSCPLIKLLQEKSTSAEITEESSPQRK